MCQRGAAEVALTYSRWAQLRCVETECWLPPPLLPVRTFVAQELLQPGVGPASPLCPILPGEMKWGGCPEGARDPTPPQSGEGRALFTQVFPKVTRSRLVVQAHRATLIKILE